MREMSHTTGWIGRVAAIAVSMLWMPLSSLGNVGAVVPFTTYEAELGSLGGGAQVLSMTNLPSAPTVELESSGRACVELNDVGESVTWTNTADCNAIVVRVSIPDSPTGGGITNTLNLYVNGVFRQSIAVNSLYTWIYEVTKFTNNNPSAGTPKRFYDMHRAFIVSNTVTAGSTIMLRKDAANTADYYRIDLIQLENVGSPISQPANTLNVTNYGAKANDQNDDSTAFKNCIAACESQGKGMWIPAGEFRTKEIISAEGINIYGAGMWYTTIHRVNGAAPNYRHKWDLTDCTIQDLYINIPQKSKQKIDGHDYGMTIQGTSSWRVERVWVHHGGAAFWCSGKDGTIKDCRSTESWADGINLNNSGSVQTTHRGLRLTCTNNYIIGPCDDGIALNAQNGSGTNWNMIDTKIRNNTSIAVNWANGIRIAGGRNSLVMHNLITDPTDSNGIRVGEFGGDGNPCESVLVCSNLVLRGCGIRTLYGHGGIAVTDDATAEIRANTILDSPGLGVDVQSCNATFIANVITRPYSNGFLVKASSIGTGIFTSNVVSGLRSGQVAYSNRAPATFTATLVGNSWQLNLVTGVTVSPVTVLLPITGTQQVIAVVSPTNATIKTVNWTSSSPSVASVSTNGLVTALYGGTATIIATTQDGGFSSTSVVTVVAVNDVVGAYQAESASFSGPVVSSNMPGYNGTGFLDVQNNTGDSITWSVNAPSAGPHDLVVRYSLAAGDRPLSLTVNGTVVVPSLSFPQTGSFSNWATVRSTQNLLAGTNTITLTTIGSNGGNIDELSVISLLSDYVIWAVDHPEIALSGPDADDDFDGVINDHERIWGLNPTNALSKNPLLITTNVAGGTFVYSRRTPALSGYQYAIWTSTNMFNWVEDVAAIQTPSVPVNDVETVTVQLSPVSGPTLFMRVRATKE